jgi:hypothetical protein
MKSELNNNITVIKYDYPIFVDVDIDDDIGDNE